MGSRVRRADPWPSQPVHSLADSIAILRRNSPPSSRGPKKEDKTSGKACARNEDGPVPSPSQPEAGSAFDSSSSSSPLYSPNYQVVSLIYTAKFVFTSAAPRQATS